MSLAKVFNDDDQSDGAESNASEFEDSNVNDSDAEQTESLNDETEYVDREETESDNDAYLDNIVNNMKPKPKEVISASTSKKCESQSSSEEESESESSNAEIDNETQSNAEIDNETQVAVHSIIKTEENPDSSEDEFDQNYAKLKTKLDSILKNELDIDPADSIIKPTTKKSVSRSKESHQKMPSVAEQKSTTPKPEKKKMPAAVETKIINNESGLSSPVVETKKRKRPSKEKPQKSIEVVKDENDLQPPPAKKSRKRKNDSSATNPKSNKLTGTSTPVNTSAGEIESSATTSDQKKSSTKKLNSKKRKNDGDDPIHSAAADSDISVSNPKKVRNVLPAHSDLKQNKQQKQMLETDKLKESMSILQKQQHDTQQQNLKHYKEQSSSSDFQLPQVSAQTTTPVKLKQISIPATASASAAASDDMDAVDMANVCSKNEKRNTFRLLEGVHFALRGNSVETLVRMTMAKNQKYFAHIPICYKRIKPSYYTKLMISLSYSPPTETDVLVLTPTHRINIEKNTVLATIFKRKPSA